MTRSPEPPKKIACTNCSRKKTRCENSADGRPCATCTQKRLDCRYPDPDAPGSGGAQRRTSCDSCHKEKVRCRRAKDGEDDTRCMNCREKNIQCVFPKAGEHEELPVADSEQPVAGPSRSQAASSVHRASAELTGDSQRPALTVDPTAAAGASTSAPVTPNTRPNSPGRNNWREVCLAPSPEREDFEESFAEAYLNQ